ncbi:MAG: hypothetical protein PVJ73_11325 [Acidobacteriota bacterium]|jgi:hypothetical protein
MPTAAPTPEPCTQALILSRDGAVPARTLLHRDFSVPRPGRLDVTMDWTHPETRMGFYLAAANTCTLEEFNARSCDFVVEWGPSADKPLRISVPSFTQGNYRYLIANYSEEQESAVMRIELSEGSCAPLAGGRPDASARDDASTPILARSQHD